MSESERGTPHQWNNRILSVYWGVVIVSALLMLIRGSLLSEDFSEFSTLRWMACLMIAGVLLAAEAVRFIRKSIHPLTVIATGMLISLALIPLDTNPNNFLYYTSMPMLVSVFYFRKAYTLVTAFLSLVGTSLLSLVYKPLLELFTLKALLVDVFAYLIGICILLLLIARVEQLMRDLANALESKRELMVRSILMDKLVKTDPLTGLYTHTSFHDYLEELIEQSKRMPFSIHLAVIDVDNFKKFNDDYGHRLGDQVLSEVARLISKMIGPDDFAARCGGEEFSILFLEKTSDQVFSTVEKIRKQITEISVIGHPKIQVSVSIGLKEYEAGLSKDEFFKNADDSMYLAKASGKNRTICTECQPSLGKEKD